MDKEKVLIVEGEVIDSLPNAMFNVRLSNGFILLCHVSGKIRKNLIKILPGDKVKVEVSAYNPKRGRIIYRMKGRKIKMEDTKNES